METIQPLPPIVQTNKLQVSRHHDVTIIIMKKHLHDALQYLFHSTIQVLLLQRAPLLLLQHSHFFHFIFHFSLNISFAFYSSFNTMSPVYVGFHQNYLPPPLPLWLVWSFHKEFQTLTSLSSLATKGRKQTITTSHWTIELFNGTNDWQKVKWWRVHWMTVKIVKIFNHKSCLVV